MLHRPTFLVYMLVLIVALAGCGNANSANVQTRDGTLSLTYPQGWLAESIGPTLVIANNIDAQVGMGNLGIFGLSTGQTGGIAFTAGASRGDTAAEVLTFAQTQTFSADGEATYTFSESEEQQFGDRPGVAAHGSAEFVTTTIDVVLIVVDFDDGYGLLLFGATPGELDGYLETVYTIAESMTFVPR